MWYPRSRCTGLALTEANGRHGLRLTQAKLGGLGDCDGALQPMRSSRPTQKDSCRGKDADEQEFIRKDENGKAYVSGSAYLSDADASATTWACPRMHTTAPGNHPRPSRQMFSSSPTERADLPRRSWQVDAEDKSKRNRGTAEVRGRVTFHATLLPKSNLLDGKPIRSDSMGADHSCCALAVSDCVVLIPLSLLQS